MTLPRSATTGEAAVNNIPRVPMDMHQVPPWAQTWAPPAIKRPWPNDEYLHDGGDRRVKVLVGDDWQIHNLDLEDTIAHFDTAEEHPDDSRTVVVESNRVHIYAPRFGAVRKVNSHFGVDKVDYLDSTRKGVRVNVDDLNLGANTVLQPLATERTGLPTGA